MLRAYHGDPALKERHVARMKDHIALDQLVQGLGWGGSKGCFIGCTVHRYSSNRFEGELGIPRSLVHTLEYFFSSSLT